MKFAVKNNLLFWTQNIILALPLIFFPRYDICSLTGSWYNIGIGMSLKVGCIENDIPPSCHVFLGNWGIPFIISVVLTLLIIYELRIIRKIKFKKEIFSALVKISTSLFLLLPGLYFLSTLLLIIIEYTLNCYDYSHQQQDIEELYWLFKAAYPFALGFLSCLVLIWLYHESTGFKSYFCKGIYYFVIITLFILMLYPGIFYLREQLMIIP